MPINVFGYKIEKKKDQSQELVSFAPPEDDDGASLVQGGGFYGTYLDFDPYVKNDIDLIFKYRDMALHPEVETAIDDICNDALVFDEERVAVSLNLDKTSLSPNIKKRVLAEFDGVLKLLRFRSRGHEIFRKWYIESRLYYHMILDPKTPKRGIVELRPIDPTKIRKVKKVNKKQARDTSAQPFTLYGETEEFYIYNERQTGTNTAGQQSNSGGLDTGLKIMPDAVCHINSGMYDATRKRVFGYLHKAIKPLNQLRMIEDAVVIYRISRAPERRVFYVDVGNLPKNKAEQYLRDIMNRYRNKLVYDASTGEMRDDRRHMSMLEDYWMPRREGGRGTEITTLDGGQNLGEMEDVDYFKKRLYQALNVPVSRLEADNGFNMGRSAEISRDEVKFYKFIERLRVKFNELFINLLKTQLIIKGVMSKEEFEELAHDVLFEYNRDNYFSELKETEIMKERLEMMREIGEFIGQFFSKEFVYKKIMKLTDEEGNEMKKQIDKERAEEPPLDDEMGGPNARR